MDMKKTTQCQKVLDQGRSKLVNNLPLLSQGYSAYYRL